MRASVLWLIVLCGSGSGFGQTPAAPAPPVPPPAATSGVVGMSGMASDRIDPAHQATPEQVREYFGLIHLEDALKTMTTQVVRNSRANSAPFIPADFWDDMTQTFNQYDIVAEYVPVYQKLLSKEDMTGILAFYRTAAGKHMIAMEPELRTESQQHFQALAKKLGQEVEARHKDEILAAKKKFDEGQQGAGAGVTKPGVAAPGVMTPAVPPTGVPKPQ